MILLIALFSALSVTFAFLIYRRLAYFDLLNVAHEKFHLLYGHAKESTLLRRSVGYDVDRIYQ
jgi:hypothetical protein